MPGKHLAAILPQKGGPLAVGERDTPTPGPTEILIETKAIAVNPVDAYQRDMGFPPVPHYPTVVGCDAAGTVVQVGPAVSNPPAIGSRVLAFASGFYKDGSADHSAFQKLVLADSEAVVPLPELLSFEEGAIMPLATLTALTGWYTLGIPLDHKYTTEDKEAVLLWGGSSSVGSVAIQSAKTMGFIVYTTAGAKNLDYMKQLGADAAFDYKESDVVEKIVAKAKADGVKLRYAHAIAPGSLQHTLDVLKETKNGPAKVAYAPPLATDHPTLDQTEIQFTMPPTDPEGGKEHLRKIFHGWLKDGLSSGKVVPSPRIEKVEGGLEGLNKALDMVKGGLSGTKAVVSV